MIRMEKLERLIQDESGTLYRSDGTKLHPRQTTPKGKICTLVVQNNTGISIAVNEMATRDSALIPVGATAYVASDFSVDTQYVRKNYLEGKEKEMICSVYSLQFYYLSLFDD